ncbi:unnamed protein product [Cuscuta campestris]|uniref:Uncharacterized protein n=1 Tax=Cuscuta campestris TaxID=132261 RepID=A0A484LDV5_9ASTE|nr:unnamed protein product [Cuscuta campestris]
MFMFQQQGGFAPFIPEMYPHALPQNSPLLDTMWHPSPFQLASVIRSAIPTNLADEINKAGPSQSKRSRSHKSHTEVTPNGDVHSVHSKDKDWDVPRAQKKLKGKVVQPKESRQLAFQRLGHEGRNQNISSKSAHSMGCGEETVPRIN